MEGAFYGIGTDYLEKTTSIYNAQIFLSTATKHAYKGNAEIQSAFVELENGLAPFGLTAAQYFRNLLHIQLISETENQLVEFLKVVLRAYPEKIGSTTFKLSEVLQASSREEIVERAATNYLNSIMYQKPLDYLQELARVLSFDPALLKGQWPDFVEAKARRDLGVHAGWRVNDTYLRKVSEVGHSCAGLKVGDHVYPDSSYLPTTIGVCDTIIDLLVKHCESTFATNKW